MANLSKAVQISIQIQEQKEELISLPQKVQEVAAELKTFSETYSEKKSLYDKEDSQRQELTRKLEEERLALVDKEKRLNGIKSQKEFQAVSREISNLKNSLKDDEANLAILEKSLEELKGELTPLESQLQNLQAQHQEEQAKISGDLQARESAIVRLEKELADTLAALPVLIQEKYHRIATVCQPPAALIVQGTCQECFIKLPPQLFIEVQRQNEVFSCPSCRRLLYLESAAEK